MGHDCWVVVAAVVAVVLLPGYLYLCSKFAQVGRMSGTLWFVSRQREIRRNGTSKRTQE